MKHVTLAPVRRNDWVIKASTFDDQILIVLWNEIIMEQRIKMFYDEEDAFTYIESIVND